MSRRLTPDKARPGMLVVDPTTGVLCDLASVEKSPGGYWLLWGERRPVGSLGTFVRADHELCCEERAPETDDGWAEW